MTARCAMRFNEPDVHKPLASAACVARAGNRVAMEEDGGFIENVKTGDRMELSIENNTFVFDIMLDNGDLQVVTLDSGAGCNVWPRGVAAGGGQLMQKPPGIKMIAANGSEIQNFGQRLVGFRGVEASSFQRPR